MSYRDLRNLCEILRAVGYPRLVSIENFRNPNFPLVADISRWLVQQYEPKTDIPSSCDTEAERVALVRAFAEFMLVNVQVRLNTKRLYQADGYAVKELLKVASVLYSAVRDAEAASSQSARGPLPSAGMMDPEHGRIDVKELKETRALTSQLVQKGVSLYDMLSKEGSLREARHQALSKAYEHSEVERLLRSAIEAGAQELKKMSTIIETVQNNLAAIDSKIEKKQSELERSQKRLQTLRKVRPAFMDEYEDLQKELAFEYENYVNRFRCLSFIQNQIEAMDRLDEERKMEERLSKVEQSRRAGGGDDLLSYGNGKGTFILNSSGSEDESDELSIGAPKNVVQAQGQALSTAGNSGGRMGSRLGSRDGGIVNGPSRKSGHHQPQRKVFGSMMGAEDSEDESEMILVGASGDNEENSELASDDDEELIALQKEQLAEENGGLGSTRTSGRGGRPTKASHQRREGHGNGNANGVHNVPNGDIVNGGRGYPQDNGRARSTTTRPSTAGRKPPAPQQQVDA